MLKFYNKIIRSFIDLPNHNSMIIHSLVGCNLKCFGCHNYDELVFKKDDHDKYFTESDILEQIKLNGFLFDAIILSGGEFLLSSLEDIENFLVNIRKVFSGVIIINTNGSFPEKIEYIINKKLADGFHVDMKLPYHALDLLHDKEIYESVIGVFPSEQFINKLLKSAEIIIKDDSKYSQVRTVKYPILSDEYFKEIQIYVEKLKEKYNSCVEYKLNEFMSI